METIGFVGLGQMGAPMAWNVADAGFDLVVYNRTRERTEPFAAAGHAVAETPAELAERATVVVTMVADDDALGAVLEGPDGVGSGLDDGDVLVNASTVSPAATAAAEEVAEAADAAFVDAPVAGTVPPAEQGTLTVVAGADGATFRRVEPVLSAWGDPVLHVGGVGTGTRTKLATNLLLGTMMEGLAEALAFAEAHDVDPETYLDVLASGGLDAPFFRAKGEKILEGDFAPQFKLDLLAKDLSLALEAGTDARLSLPATAAAREAVDGARGLGHGGEDMAAVYRYLAPGDKD